MSQAARQLARLLVLGSFLPAVWRAGIALGEPAGRPEAAVIRAPDGRVIRLEAPAKGVLVLVFYSAECPISNAYSPTLNDLARAYPADRLRLVGLCVDPDRTDAQLVEHATEYGLRFPIGRDRGLAVARRYGVTKTPEAVVLDADGRVRYRGRIDDQFAARSKKNRHPRTHELRDAIAAVLDGREVERPEVEAVGCPLPELAGPEPAPAAPAP